MTFPTAVWDGTSKTRPHLMHEQPPTFQDWLTVVAELQAVQKYLLNITDNIREMPNLDAMLKDADTKISELLQRVNAVTPPEELLKAITSVREALDEVDSRGAIASLEGRVQLSEQHIAQQQLAIAAIQQELDTQVRQFQNKIRNDFSTFQAEVRGKLTTIDTAIGNLQNMISIASALTRLKQ